MLEFLRSRIAWSQAPLWLPYRWRAAVDNYRIDRATAGIDATAPTPAADPTVAVAEVHVLLCRRDVRIGAVALKSLLRFAPGRLAVTLTDDGSLTPQHRAWIDAQLPHARWLPRRVEEPAFRAALGRYPRLAALYEQNYHPLCKLLHAAMLARHQRVIVLDPDTAFFRPPELLLRWLAGDDAAPYYLHDHQDEAVAVPEEARRAFADLAARLGTDRRPWRIDRYFFNSGLLLYRPDQIDLAAAEGYLQWRETCPLEYRQGKLGIWFGDWTPEQTGYLAAFATAVTAARPLGTDYHLGGETGFAFNHFLRHYLIQAATLREIRSLVRELSAGRA
ncbi:hypothetical protein [Limnoglobus roseus]|uniref:Uncharacterized protein n=1 Tax=Limnoglobus roseus TaxID=2598579 RepID=A0A5C1ABF3_9BACT|nr:hypothetical protein [Limnoglobus roseus]QEL15557.1 hypothetical protein PX52LOC_02482 [Limnoglobus roseus]